MFTSVTIRFGPRSTQRFHHMHRINQHINVVEFYVIHSFFNFFNSFFNSGIVIVLILTPIYKAFLATYSVFQINRVIILPLVSLDGTLKSK